MTSIGPDKLVADLRSAWKSDSARLKFALTANDGGVWGDDPTGADDTIVLRSTDQTGAGDWSLNEPAVRHLSPRERANALLRAGDLVVTKSSGSAVHIGKTTLVGDDLARLNVCFGNFMQRLRPGRPYSSRYLWYVLNHELVKSQIAILSTTTTGLANLNGHLIGEIKIPRPPEDDQHRIAAFLDRETAKIDELIGKQEQLIAALRERRAAVIAHAVTKGLDPIATLRESGVQWIGDVPAHWRMGNIRRFAAMKTGHTPSRSMPEYWENCTIPWFTLADVWQLRDDRATYLGETASCISQLGLVNSAAELLPAHTVVLSRTASVGFSGIMPVPMATSQDYWNWVCGDGLLPCYLLQVFRAMRPEFGALIAGSTHQTIYQPVAAGMIIPVPPVSEQCAIADYIETATTKIDSLIAKAQRFIELSKERRAALISAAVTGQIDVRKEVA